MNAEKKRLRDEVAELSEAVRELREQLAQRQQHVCCPGACCHCARPVWVYPHAYYPPIYPYTVIYGSSTTPISGTVTTSYALTS